MSKSPAAAVQTSLRHIRKLLCFFHGRDIAARILEALADAVQDAIVERDYELGAAGILAREAFNELPIALRAYMQRHASMARFEYKISFDSLQRVRKKTSAHDREAAKRERLAHEASINAKMIAMQQQIAKAGNGKGKAKQPQPVPGQTRKQRQAATAAAAANALASASAAKGGKGQQAAQPTQAGAAAQIAPPIPKGGKAPGGKAGGGKGGKAPGGKGGGAQPTRNPSFVTPAIQAVLMTKYQHEDFYAAHNEIFNPLTAAEKKLRCFMVDDLGLPTCTYNGCKKCN